MDAISNLKANLNKYISNWDKLAQLDEDDKKDEIKFHGEVAQLTNKHSKGMSWFVEFLLQIPRHEITTLIDVTESFKISWVRSRIWKVIWM